MKNLIYIVAIIALGGKLYAQDPEFTQFNSVPLYLNPAFTGATNEHRFGAVYRNQWPGLEKSFVSYMVSYDYNWSKKNSGLGGFVLQDKAGSSNLIGTQVGANYSYVLPLSDGIDIRGGLQARYGQRKFQYANLQFNDQFVTGAATSLDASADAPPIMYFDAGTGVLIESDMFYFGFSANHLNRPNVSLKGGNQPLNVLYSLHGGYKYALTNGDSPEKDPQQTIGGLFHYRHQGVNDQLDLGVSYFNRMINFTVWYRGIPMKTYKPTNTNHESLAFLIGFEPADKKIKVGYSYDLTISNLGLANTSGAHEVTVRYELGKKPSSGRKARQAIGGSMKF
ncbi:MAG: type IX secretion system membrane protein PorP/SprF [Sphingobacteriaceae bacterium]